MLGDVHNQPTEQNINKGKNKHQYFLKMRRAFVSLFDCEMDLIKELKQVRVKSTVRKVESCITRVTVID